MGDGLGNGREVDTRLRGELEVFPCHTIQAEAQNLFKSALIKGALVVRMEWQPQPQFRVGQVRSEAALSFFFKKGGFFFFFLVVQQGMQDLSSLTRDQTCSGSRES